MGEKSGMKNGLLTIKDLKTYFFTRWGVVKAVDDIDISLGKGETLGLVGESGCGKSVTALSILRLVPRPRGRIVGERSSFRGVISLHCKKIKCVPSGEGRSV